MRDALIVAPAADMFFRGGTIGAATLGPPSPKEIIAEQAIELRRLRNELERLRITANTIADTAAGLACLAEPGHDQWVTIPREMKERMRNEVKLCVREHGGDTQVRWVTRTADHVFEGRSDG